MKSTIKDVARMAGVSIGTVDRVLHKRGRVSLETRQRVEKVIRDLKYQPNIFAKNLVKNEPVRLGVLMPRTEQDGEFWRLPEVGIRQAKRDLKPLNVSVRIYSYDKYSDSDFEKIAEQALQDNLRGILIAPTQVEAARRLVSSLPAGFPFIYFDSHIPKTGALSSVIQDSRNSGTVAARLMRLLVPGEEEVQILRFLPSDYHLEQRIKGFCKYFCGNGKKEIEILDIPGHYSGEVLAEMLDTHFSGQFPRGIFVINSKIFEVADYLSNRGLGEQVALVGYDLIPQNIKFLKQGVIDFLISQSPELQGYTGLISLYRHLMFQESIDLEIRLPIEIITKENVDSYASTRSLDAFGQKVSMIYSD